MKICIQIELLSDLIVSASSATAGEHQCLDFIPGSVLLGAVLGKIEDPYLRREILRTNALVCSNALPWDATTNERFVPVPFSLHTLKGQVRSKSHPFEVINAADENFNPTESKQLRSGFLSNSSICKTRKSHRMKTAIDNSQFGKSEDSQLFGYTSLSSGQTFAASITLPDEVRASMPLLCNGGECFLGRSRSAEYGRVRITPLERGFADPPRGNSTDHRAFAYCLSDLSLLNSEGFPSLVPSPEAFKLAGAQFLPQESFIRTRSYWPWNRFYNGPDIEHQVICAGSVIVFKLQDACYPLAISEQVGQFCAEGLGQIFWNPKFILCPPKACVEVDAPMAPSAPLPALSDLTSTRKLSPTVKLAGRLQSQLKGEQDAILKGKALARRLLASKGSNKHFPGRSQWAYIRSVCGNCPPKAESAEKLKDQLHSKYFRASLRRKAWGEGEGSLSDLILKHFSEYKGSAPRSLYHAAITVYRDLANNRRTKN